MPAGLIIPMILSDSMSIDARDGYFEKPTVYHTIGRIYLPREMGCNQIVPQVLYLTCGQRRSICLLMFSLNQAGVISGLEDDHK